MAPITQYDSALPSSPGVRPAGQVGAAMSGTGARTSANADMAQTVRELTQLVNEAQAQVRQLQHSAKQGPSQKSTWARTLAAEAQSSEAAQTQVRVRRLREALRDSQSTMERSSAQHGPSAEVDALRMQCQQDELRAQACEAELSHLLQHQELLGSEVAHSRRRQEQERRSGQEGHSAAQTLPISGVEGQGAGLGEPPAAIRPELDEVVQQVQQMLRRKLRVPSPQSAESFADAETSHEMAAIQGKFAHTLMSPKMPNFADPSDLVQWVIRQAHTDGAQDIRGYAGKLHYSTQLKTIIRDELARARQFRAEHAANLKEGVMDKAFDSRRISRDPAIGDDGMPKVRPVEPAGDILRVEEMDAHIADLQNMLASTGDDMQISQLELQNMTQRQQQVMNVLSNLSKTLHETSMAIIRKIGT